MHDTDHPRRTRNLFPVLVGAAAIAGMLAAAGIALIGEFSARSTAVAIFYGACTLAALAGVTWSTTNVNRLVVLAAVTGGTAVPVLFGIISFGPLFFPALILWSIAGLVQWQRAEHAPPGLLIAKSIVWGIFVAMIGSFATLVIIG